jgi:hypothetical protein
MGGVTLSIIFILSWILSDTLAPEGGEWSVMISGFYCIVVLWRLCREGGMG